MQLCFATNNFNKLKEARHLLGDRFEIVGLESFHLQELAEDADTLEGNSMQKALYILNHYDIPCFADDTGLEVDALSGAPGVLSARYGGKHGDSEANISLLLHNMNHIHSREARFRTVISYVSRVVSIQFEGILSGRIIRNRRGGKGFGYDPVFVPTGETLTLAEMTMEEKNAISHRAVALKQMVDYLKSHGG